VLGLLEDCFLPDVSHSFGEIVARCLDIEATQMMLMTKRTYAKIRASTLIDENNNEISCTRTAQTNM